MDLHTPSLQLMVLQVCIGINSLRAARSSLDTDAGPPGLLIELWFYCILRELVLLKYTVHHFAPAYPLIKVALVFFVRLICTCPNRSTRRTDEPQSLVGLLFGIKKAVGHNYSPVAGLYHTSYSQLTY